MIWGGASASPLFGVAMQFKNGNIPKALRNGFAVQYALIHALKLLGYNRQQRRAEIEVKISG